MKKLLAFGAIAAGALLLAGCTSNTTVEKAAWETSADNFFSYSAQINEGLGLEGDKPAALLVNVEEDVPGAVCQSGQAFWSAYWVLNNTDPATIEKVNEIFAKTEGANVITDPAQTSFIVMNDKGMNFSILPEEGNIVSIQGSSECFKPTKSTPKSLDQLSDGKWKETGE